MWQVAGETGWTVDYILWGVPAQTLMMMLADAPHYEKHHTAEDDGMTDEERQLGYFRSVLNKMK